MRLAVAILAAVLFTSCSAASPETSPSPVVFDSLIQVHVKDSAFLLLDVRTPEEYGTGHIAGARLVDFHSPDFQARVAALPRKASILLYCRSGNRSGQALRMMQDMGFIDVRHLAGGINGWQAEGRPMVR